MQRESLELLLVLQEVDSALDANDETVAALDPGDAQRAVIEQLRARAEETSTRHYELDKEALDVELEVKSIEEKRKQVYDKLYSGRIRNPKELSDLEAEHAALGRHVDSVQDTGLALIDQVEEAKAQMEAARRALQEAKAKLLLMTETYQREQERLSRERETLEPRRAELVEQLPAGLLKRYEAVRERRGGLAVVRVTGDTCPGCQVSIPKDLFRAPKKPTGLMTCESCGRIFVLGK